MHLKAAFLSGFLLGARATTVIASNLEHSFCDMLREASFRSFQARLDSRNPLNGQAVSRKVL
jgi:hypothetical protein